jgi:hypothetical protein
MMMNELTGSFVSTEELMTAAIAKIAAELAVAYRARIDSSEFSLAEQSDIELGTVDGALTVIATGGYHIGFDLFKASQTHPEIVLYERDLEATKIDTLDHTSPKELFVLSTDQNDEPDKEELALPAFVELPAKFLPLSELIVTEAVLREQLEAIRQAGE